MQRAAEGHSWSNAYLVRSFAVIVLIDVICNSVDVERRDYFDVWAALLQREVHPCMV